MRKPLILAALGVIAVLAMGADDSCSVEENPKPAKQSKSNQGNNGGNKKNTPAEPQMTPGQENALESAQGYLDYTAFSKSGLIDQLVQFEGFSKADATFAVNSLDVDWKQQAYQSAKDYLDYTSFSLSGLIDQLAQFEGFTQAQAQYGANKAYNEG